MNSRIYFLFSISLIIIACQKDFSPVGNESNESFAEILYPPDKNLPLKEILDQQHITSIHFKQWDSVSVNNKPGASHSISWEIFLDSKRIRTVQYYLDNVPWIVTVIDIDNWSSWQYDLMFNQYREISFPDTNIAFETIAKRHITSRLISNLQGNGFEYINNYYCHLVNDSNNNKEWIWVEHRLPVKWIKTFYPDGIKVNSHTILEINELNVDFSDSLFIKP